MQEAPVHLKTLEPQVQVADDTPQKFWIWVREPSLGQVCLTVCWDLILGVGVLKTTWHFGLLLRVLGTYNRNIRESQRVKGLTSKLSPQEKSLLVMASQLWSLRLTGVAIL